MFYAIGLLIALASFLAAVTHLNQHASNYTDFVAFVIVLGGTLAVAVIIFPWQYRRELVTALRTLIYQPERNLRWLLSECINFVRQRGAIPSVQTQGLAGEVLRDGAELIGLGFTRERLKEVLEVRILQSIERKRKVANAFRALAKYPPAFGLAGTVLGLVSLMRAVSTGADAKTVGVQMAVALIATLYGLISANLLINPAGELVLKVALEEQKQAEIALHAVLLGSSGANPLEAQELLNSFVPPHARLNAIGSLNESQGAAAA